MKSLPTIKRQLVNELEQLQQKYLDAFEIAQDVKMLQGVERCIELKMKIDGIDGKQQPIPLQKKERNLAVDLSKLSQNSLQEIADLIDKPKLNT